MAIIYIRFQYDQCIKYFHFPFGIYLFVYSISQFLNNLFFYIVLRCCGLNNYKDYEKNSLHFSCYSNLYLNEYLQPDLNYIK
ncbi:hypothetical protein HZS_6722 [Henneguya salminicola]|nr:hypothetical protein HZS_6722 [Henneguya salminicola]